MSKNPPHAAPGKKLTPEARRALVEHWKKRKSAETPVKQPNRFHMKPQDPRGKNPHATAIGNAAVSRMISKSLKLGN